MNELQITIHNWKHISDKDVNAFIRITLFELYEKNIDYNRVKEYHREFDTHGIELYLKWK